MTVEQFLISWIVRSAILTLAGAILLRVFRVQDASFRLASWTAILCASSAIPILIGILPEIPVMVPRGELASYGEKVAGAPQWTGAVASVPGTSRGIDEDVAARARLSPSFVRAFDWSDVVVGLYAAVCTILLLRIAVALAIGARLRRDSIPTGLKDVRESSRIDAPMTLGVVRPAILLPMDWREWDRAKLDAVLAHERSHMRRSDPTIQLCSAIHRALLWANPLSWFLHAKIVQTAEEISDDAAVTVSDRVGYAEILLEFMKRDARGPILTGLRMARYGNPEKRLLRILDQPVLSSGITKRAVAAIIGVSLPLTCVTAAAKAEFVPLLDKIRVLPPLASYPSPPAVVNVGSPIVPTKVHTSAPAPMLAQVVAQTRGPVNQETSAAEVRLTVSVTDPVGRYVVGLSAQDFRVTAGQTSPVISSFGLAAAEHSIVLLNTMAGGNDSVNALRKVLDPRDQVDVLTGPPASEVDMFWEAIAQAVNQAKGMANPYKSVIVMMQGGSEYPISREADLARIIRLTLHAPRVTVSFANVEDITKPYSQAPSQQDDLRILAAITGGQVVAAPNTLEMATSLTRIGVGLAKQYVLGFSPGNVRVGLLGRPPQVDVVPNSGYPPFHVIGPGGYYTEP